MTVPSPRGYFFEGFGQFAYVGRLAPARRADGIKVDREVLLDLGEGVEVVLGVGQFYGGFGFVILVALFGD